MKPACGSGEEVGEYDLPLHVVALCMYRTSTNMGYIDGLTKRNSLGHGILMSWYDFIGAPGERLNWYTDADVQERAFPSWQRRSSG